MEDYPVQIFPFFYNKTKSDMKNMPDFIVLWSFINSYKLGFLLRASAGNTSV